METVTWLPLLRFEGPSFVHLCYELICVFRELPQILNSLRSEHTVHDVYRQQRLHAES